MKRCYLIISSISIFLLFSFLVLAGTDDYWKECSPANDKVGDPDHEIYIDPTTYYCCYIGGQYQWQDTECPTCPVSDSTCLSPDGSISCGGSMSDCLNTDDWKYYRVSGSAEMEVTVTLTHFETGCNC